MSKFFPAITVGSSEDQKQAAFYAARNGFKIAAKLTMQTPEGEEIVTRYKANGSVNGHKVIDDADCARKLADVAPEALKSAMDTTLLSVFQKAQIVNGLLRSQWVLDKTGKIARDESGNMVMSPKLLAKLA
jgi:hypothetical protein